MMNLNNEYGLIDLNTWQLLLKQLSDLTSFHAKTIKKIFDYIPRDKSLPHDAIMTLCCGDESRFDEVFFFYQEAALRQYPLEVYMPQELHDAWQAFVKLKHCLIIPIDSKEINFKTERWLFVDLLANLSTRHVKPSVEPWISQINTHEVPVISIDIATGLDASNGTAMIKEPLKVDYVIARLALMQGIFTGIAKAFVGQAILLDQSVEKPISYQSYLLNQSQIESLLPEKIAYAYKGMYARVLIIAGEKEMFGASLLAARAALIMGAGWVEVFYQQGLNPPIGELPEIIWHEVTDIYSILAHIQSDDILVFGPGLGQGAWGLSVWQAVQNLENKMLIDASALHYLAESDIKAKQLIITPHPGEAATLLGSTSSAIQKDRFVAIKKLHKRYHAAVVLKGSGSLILTPENMIYICPHGNPAMASQGMGDVLSGLIAGLWAHTGNQSEAMILGVWLHAKAADLLFAQNPDIIALRASQILDEIENHIQDVLCK